MSAPVLDKLERKERLFIACAVFTAKVITWTALILLVLVIELALVIKVFHLEFGSSAHHADSSSAVQLSCACVRSAKASAKDGCSATVANRPK